MLEDGDLQLGGELLQQRIDQRFGDEVVKSVLYGRGRAHQAAVRQRLHRPCPVVVAAAERQRELLVQLICVGEAAALHERGERLTVPLMYLREQSA